MVFILFLSLCAIDIARVLLIPKQSSPTQSETPADSSHTHDHDHSHHDHDHSGHDHHHGDYNFQPPSKGVKITQNDPNGHIDIDTKMDYSDPSNRRDSHSQQGYDYSAKELIIRYCTS